MNLFPNDEEVFEMTLKIGCSWLLIIAWELRPITQIGQQNWSAYNECSASIFIWDLLLSSSLCACNDLKYFTQIGYALPSLSVCIVHVSEINFLEYYHLNCVRMNVYVKRGEKVAYNLYCSAVQDNELSTLLCLLCMTK